MKNYKLKESVTEEQLAECGFEFNDRYIYPKAMTKKIDDLNFIMINIGEVCINCWSGKDENRIGIIYVHCGNIGNCNTQETKDYIEDLIDKGYVEVQDVKD